MRKTSRLTVGLALTAALTLGAGGTALASEPDPRASCAAGITSAYVAGARDDLQQLHNEVFKAMGVVPGPVIAASAQMHGTQEACLRILPPDLVVPPHP